MANQMIALGARAPQVDILGGTIQRNAQMLNMMMQQKAAERQTAKTEQEMALAQQTANLTAEEKRRAFRKADMEYLNNQLPGVKDDISWNRWLGELKKVDPGLSDDLLRRTGGRYIPEVVDIVGATAEQYLNKKVATPVASFGVSDQGIPQSITSGGLEPSVKEIPQYRYEPDQPAAAASAPSMTAEEAAPILKSAAESQTITPEDADRVRRSLGPNGGAQFDQWITRNNIQIKPISFEQSDVEPLTVENAPQIVQAALDSGFIDPTHVEQMKQMLPPENQAAVDQWVQQSGLKMGKSIPGAQSAVYRPQAQDFNAPVADAGMSFSGPANALRQDIGYVPTTTRFKPPTQSPLPGSAQVPLPRVRAEAQAQRETPGEVYAKEKARAKAQREAALEAGPKPLTPTQEAKLRDNIAKDYKSAQSTIDMMLNPVSGVVAAVQSVRNLTPAQKEAITGLSGYLYSVTPSSRQADTKVKNLMGKVTEMGKAAASLTGAIGQMAVQEWRIVRDMIANLDLTGMEASDLDDQLEIIETQARRAAAITQDAYENQYVEEFARYPNRFQLKVPGSSAPANQMSRSNLPRVRNNADFNRLKPGTLFIDPNGETRRKP